MESSGISLYYKVLTKKEPDSTETTPASDEAQSDHTVSEYLINLIDSPGHIDFASEVASAARLSDGALVLVDVVEGVCTQTISVLRQAWVENVQPVLFLNKIDRLIVEWQMGPSEAYVHIQQLIEQVNAVLAGFWEGDRLADDSRKLELAKEKWKETHGEDAPMTDWYLEEKDDSHIYFSPEQGNVLFGSAIDGWAFRVNHFAQVFAEKLGTSPAKLQPLMWGDYFIDPKNKRRVLTRKQYSKLYGAGKATLVLPLFVQLCFVPIWQVYQSVIIDHDEEKIDKVISTLGTKVLPRDRRSKDRRTLLTAIMQGWLPLAQACMVAILEKLPSPIDAQPLRLLPLVQGGVKSASDHKAAEPKNEAERALFNCDSGSEDSVAPMVAYIGKVISVPRDALPELSSTKSQRNRKAMTAEEMRALGREAVRREFSQSGEASSATPVDVGSGVATPQDSGAQDEGVPVDSLVKAINEKLNTDPAQDIAIDNGSDQSNAEDEILIGFGRIYSGTVRVGDTVWAMQPKYDPMAPDSQQYLKEVNVEALYMLMGREFVCLQQVPAGNVFGIRGISGAIIKSGTLASDSKRCPNLAAMHSETYPIVRVALEPINPHDMNKLVRGLELLNQADPCVQVSSQSTGERVLVTAGELHLERCMKDLRERFARCEIHVSEPIVPFRESIVRQNAQPGVVLGGVGASGQSLATVSAVASSQGNSNNQDDSPGLVEPRAKPAEGQQRGEVSVTTPNGLVTITLIVEPLPEKTIRFLQRHEGDIQRIVKLSSSKRRQALNSAAEALESANTDDVVPSTPATTSVSLNRIIANDGIDADNDEHGGKSRSPKPSRVSELCLWLQGRLCATLDRAKGWDPQRVQHIAEHGLRMFGPRRVGANMLIYSKDVLLQYKKPTLGWFKQQKKISLQGSLSSAATPLLSDDDEETESDSETAPLAEPTRTTITICDFEESVNTGFQLATQTGPLCFEPLIGVAVTVKGFEYNGSSLASANMGALSGQIITTVRDAVKMGFLHWSPRLHLAMYTCDIQATSEVLGKVYAVINRRHGRILSEEMREGTPYFTIKATIPIVESFGFSDEIRKRTSGAAIPLLIFRGFESLDEDPFWVPTTEEELEDLGEKADRENEAKRYMDKVRKRKGLFVERKI
ncbi:Cytoplasmic GTPase/eEF2-like protein (ribosomal biogenesis), partial [Coemansia sp. RSA 2399]